MSFIFRLSADSSIDIHLHGGKVFGLWRLSLTGAPIPQTVVVPKEVELLAKDIPWIIEQLGLCEHVIVRSSTEVEDHPSQSLAGVFSSCKTTFDGLIKAVSEVREQARRWLSQTISESNIAVIIQPYITGAGGVYLSDQYGMKDQLTLSRYGPTAITSGVSTQLDQLAPRTREFELALYQCRAVQKALSGSVDLELLLQDGKCIFLQYRSLVTWQYVFRESNISSLSQYFPTWLTPLCGTLWVQQLRKTLHSNVSYESGFIIGLDDSTSSVNTKLDEAVLNDTVKFYKNRLFRNWNRRFCRLHQMMNHESPIQTWRKIHTAWTIFLDEYFNNPYEHIVTAAKAVNPHGTTFSPGLRERFACFFQARRALLRQDGIDKEAPRKWLELPEVQSYFARYGHYFLEGNDFAQPTLAEQPESLLPMLRLPLTAEVFPRLHPTPLLKAAWLSEDDNHHKHKFAYLLRLAILKLGEYLAQNGALSSPSDIWSLSVEDLDQVLATESTELKLTPLNQKVLVNKLPIEGRFAAIALSPGCVTGVATRLSPAVGGMILVRPVIETTDYPALMASSGAVVALGSVESHAALFARDIHKPLYRCPMVANAVAEGSVLKLQASPSQITVTQSH